MMVYSQAQLEEKIIHENEMISESYQICLAIYETTQVNINIKLEDIKQKLPTMDLDALDGEYEKSLSLFSEIKKMLSSERKRRRYAQMLKNKQRICKSKTNVKLTRKYKRLQEAQSVIINNGLPEQ